MWKILRVKQLFGFRRLKWICFMMILFLFIFLLGIAIPLILGLHFPNADLIKRAFPIFAAHIIGSALGVYLSAQRPNLWTGFWQGAIAFVTWLPLATFFSPNSVWFSISLGIGIVSFLANLIGGNQWIIQNLTNSTVDTRAPSPVRASIWEHLFVFGLGIYLTWSGWYGINHYQMWGERASNSSVISLFLLIVGLGFIAFSIWDATVRRPRSSGTGGGAGGAGGAGGGGTGAGGAPGAGGGTPGGGAPGGGAGGGGTGGAGGAGGGPGGGAPGRGGWPRRLVRCGRPSKRSSRRVRPIEHH